MFAYLPELRSLRTFIERVHALFEREQSEHRAWCRRAALVARASFQNVPELAQALAMLEATRFAKMVAFLKSPAAKQVRTNHHVERANRKLRYYEKVGYKRRRRRALVRFLLLAIDRWWREHPLQGKHHVPAPLATHRSQATRLKPSKPRNGCQKTASRLSG